MRGGALTVAESRLLDDLTAPAASVIEHVSLARIVRSERAAGDLGHLTPRENDVLELMARGLTNNNAICDELHLSIKTVEPIVGTVFDRLELHAERASNRRVLAVLTTYGRARTANGQRRRSRLTARTARWSATARNDARPLLGGSAS